MVEGIVEREARRRRAKEQRTDEGVGLTLHGGSSRMDSQATHRATHHVDA
jgi:hypothetical protein